MPTFYQNLIAVWIDMKDYIKIDEGYRGNEIFLNNDCVQIGGHSIFYETLFLKNIYRLHHICDEDGKLKTEAYFKMGGLLGEELPKIREIYSAVPQEWKNNVKPLRKANHSGLNLNFLFYKKNSDLKK